MARSATSGSGAGPGTGTGAGQSGGPAAGQGAAVPERLLAEATRLFAERGYDRTSVQEIVEAAGVTKGALYHYFGSKDDLLHEIYGRVLRLQTERLDAIAARPTDVRERLADAAADVVVTSIENLDDTKIFFRSMHQLSPEKQKAVRAERRRYHETFRSLIEEGQRDGHFRDGLRPDLVVDYFFGSVHHLGTWYHADGPLSAEQVATEFSDLLLHSVLRP
jgi:AcrR family transcriptional regulator